MNELKLQLTVAEVNKVIEALGHLPYLQVYELISKLHAQAQEQLSSSPQSNGSVMIDHPDAEVVQTEN
ncbi:MAG: hypothetical protein A3D31_05165 [Candidatus Fluviicola riflensis]|nr:MAG: hypothetical protein CHH17_09850 [Candidatus Fluviicola riflensis]OGS79364.1 MAG: hypothetical protein A3D31_05165 [Candidatus Fluviicola riflensis]OGS86796.1 MAG: hypothetical protein A2724_04625 [Fluviicola sp. RIFCSPHIGHO2_01_FULL_43_53]OGS88731.1 MAG: hypothetical protein A3E30_00035 [Fluviicola sp. RIFCSPHIGHO2_12_FULL_43_24]